MLETINKDMEALGINYAFMEWCADPIYPYFVGEYSENEPLTEDGEIEIPFILTGFTRESWSELERIKEKIMRYYGVAGKTVITDEGSAVAIFYGGSQPVPTGDAELKKIQINLKVKEWKVN
ncbi:hypothetical protein [Emergencia sp. 1XD21-10]|uniref:hypothetical protein n=1 Tax=Emergencia sp. 1XD21-10 TaxID=2304569 RepID=UPI00137AC65C|nr:hypothetical protein [Emergencia sp. 1XD21-10]NCE98403.1 hypothetical protein [Emergencia sp. 1XD21-10]